MLVVQTSKNHHSDNADVIDPHLFGERSSIIPFVEVYCSTWWITNQLQDLQPEVSWPPPPNQRCFLAAKEYILVVSFREGRTRPVADPLRHGSMAMS